MSEANTRRKKLFFSVRENRRLLAFGSLFKNDILSLMGWKKFLYWWGPPVAWCFVIFGLSSITTPPKVGFIWWDFILKKSAHMAEYAVLYFLFWRATAEARIKIQSAGWRIKVELTRQNLKLTNNRIWLIPIIFGLVYGLSDEYHQRFVLGRTSRLRDVGFDLAGLLMAMFLIKRKLIPHSAD